MAALPAPAPPAEAADFAAELLPTLLNVSLTAVCVLRPVYGGADGAGKAGELTDFLIDYLNPTGQRMVGPPQPGDTICTRFPHALESGLLRFYQRVFETGQADRYEVNYQADGLDNYFHVAAQRQGERLVVSFTDTADHRRTAVEEALRQSQARERAARVAAEAHRGELQRLFEQAPVAVAVFRGPRYVIEWANPAVCAMWGRTPAQAQDMPLFELLPEAAGQGFEQLLDGVMTTGVAHVAHELPSFIDRAGQHDTVYWNFVYQPLREVSGQIAGVTVVATEVTEQVKARQQIAELNKDLARANEQLRASNGLLEQRVADRTHALLITLEQLERRGRELAQALAAEQELGELKSRFVSMASHEFRTPLTVVLSSVALIAKYSGAGQQEKRLQHLDHIRASVKQLNGILEQFLSAGSLEEGKMSTHPAVLDLGALLAETAADLQPQLRPGQRIDQRARCPDPFQLDGSLLRKILVNLLSNASKYSAENAVITVRAACQRGQLVLTVQDQGVGISAEDQAHLFGRFFRARSAADVPGTGLGLYIIAKYLELMGGTILLKSTLGVGTLVTLSIPYEDHPAN